MSSLMQPAYAKATCVYVCMYVSRYLICPLLSTSQGRFVWDQIKQYLWLLTVRCSLEFYCSCLEWNAFRKRLHLFTSVLNSGHIETSVHLFSFLFHRSIILLWRVNRSHWPERRSSLMRTQLKPRTWLSSQQTSLKVNLTCSIDCSIFGISLEIVQMYQVSIIWN